MHAGTRRVGDDDVGATVLLYEGLVQHVLHVARIEQRVPDAVQPTVLLGILNGGGDILNANYLAALAGEEVGDSSGSRIEVVDQLVALQAGKVACYLI